MSQISGGVLREEKGRPLLRSLTVLTAVLGGVAIVLFSGVAPFESYNISAPSMVPTLMTRDHILVDRHAFGWFENHVPPRGEIIVFRNPENPEEKYLKRVVGLPGDRIATKGDVLYINDWPVPRCRAGRASARSGNGPHPGEVFVEFLGDFSYLVFHDQSLGPLSDSSIGPFVVSPGELFVMGDNRENSFDSRSWFSRGGGRGGGLPLDLLLGRASVVWMTAREGARSELHFIKLDAPHCRSMLSPETCEGMKRCLSERPSRDATNPPPPR